MNTFLSCKWTVSRGRDTYGYNICTIRDTRRETRHACNGGGYDMQGTSFGNWLQDTYQARLVAIKTRAHSVVDTDGYHDQPGADLYGLSYHIKGNRCFTDGACGLSSMLKIAEAIGLKAECIYSRKGDLEGIYIIDTQDTD